MAFEDVMMICARKPMPVYGGRMAESLLAILCHIHKVVKILAERLEEEKPAPKTQQQIMVHRAPLIHPPWPRELWRNLTGMPGFGPGGEQDDLMRAMMCEDGGTARRKKGGRAAEGTV